MDIMLALDLSWSMMAQDMGGPNERVSRFDIASEVAPDEDEPCATPLMRPR